MTIKETYGYWKNGAWYPYTNTRLKLENVKLENDEGIFFPGKFDICMKMKLTADEFDKWVKIAECTDGVIVAED